jgi:hypothetical protein
MRLAGAAATPILPIAWQRGQLRPQVCKLLTRQLKHEIVREMFYCCGIRDTICSIGSIFIQRFLSWASFSAAATIGFARNGDRESVNLLDLRLGDLERPLRAASAADWPSSEGEALNAACMPFLAFGVCIRRRTRSCIARKAS